MGPLIGPVKSPLRLVDELSALQHRNKADIIAEHLIVTSSCSTLRAYAAPSESAGKADVVAAVRSLDSMVARSMFNRDKLVGMLDTLLRMVQTVARSKGHEDVVRASSEMQALLKEYRSHPCKPQLDYVE
jgi:hypothetical protein